MNSGSMLTNGATSTAAAPESAPAATHVSVETRPTLMPISVDAPGSELTARIAKPLLE